jgi:hypothetical protein
MKITVAQLRTVSELVLKRLEDRGHSVLDISADYYWNIPKEQKYDREQEPRDLDIGQLSEDWSWLEKIAAGEREPVVFALVWLGEIFRYLGEEIGD